MTELSHIDAVILCGGLGTRLRSEIGESQKVAAEVAGQPFLEYNLEYLRQQGVKKVVLSVGYKAELLKQYQGGFRGLEIEFKEDGDKPLGTGGALNNIRALISSNNFLVLNGDSFCFVEYRKLLDFHIGKKAIATIVVTKVNDSSSYGTVKINNDDRVLRFLEKQTKLQSGIVNAGVYCFETERYFSQFNSKHSYLEKDIFPWLVNANALYAFEM